MGVEQHYPEQDGNGDDSHASTVAVRRRVGQVSAGEGAPCVRGGAPPTSNEDGRSRIEGEVIAAPAVGVVVPSEVIAAPAVGVVVPSTASGVRAQPTEDALLQRAAAGDAGAFREIFLRHRADVARLVYRMSSSPSDLEDVVQEVFVQVFRSLKTFRGRSKFSTWLHRVTVNVVLMHRRSASSRPVLTEPIPSDRIADEQRPLPDEEAERGERLRAFERLLARLADKKRVVFVLHELEGLAPVDIAAIVGAPVLTVRTRLFYARRELEAMLADEPALANVRAAIASKETEDEGDG